MSTRDGGCSAIDSRHSRWRFEPPRWREHVKSELRLVVEVKERDDEPEEADSIREEFLQNMQKWVAETAHLSSPNKQTQHPSYLRIIGLGEAAIPLILNELQNNPRFWFVALSAISGEQPMPEADFGNIGAMRDKWLQWGREKGYLR